MKHVAPLRYDVIFKKAFGQPEVFTAFANDFLGIHLEIDKVTQEKAFDIPIGPVKPRFDLYAEDLKNRVIVDIQQQRYPDHYDRFLYYHCAALLEQAARSKAYKPDLTVYTLVVLTSGDWHKTDMAFIDFDPKNRKGEPLHEIHHKLIYICPRYPNDDTPPELREWMEAIVDTFDEEVDETKYRPEIQHIFDLIEKSLVTPEENARMKEQEGQNQKVKELEEQVSKSKEEERKEIARNMLNEGEDRVKIAKFTGLTFDQINELSAEMTR